MFGAEVSGGRGRSYVIARRFSQPLLTIPDRQAHLFEDLNYPLPDHFAMLARLGAEVADETTGFPTVALKIIDLSKVAAMKSMWTSPNSA